MRQITLWYPQQCCCDPRFPQESDERHHKEDDGAKKRQSCDRLQIEPQQTFKEQQANGDSHRDRGETKGRGWPD